MVVRIVGVVLLALGVLVLVYRGFSVPRESEGNLGPISVRMKRSERVEVPTWVGVACIIGGGGALLYSSRRR